MATGVAAAVARARREIQHHFFSADAVRPDRAVAFDAYSMIEQRQFDRMRSRGIIHEEKPGLYWMDVVSYDVDLRQRFRRVRILLLVMIAALLIGLLVSTAFR
jgi:hypothetical protein